MPNQTELENRLVHEIHHLPVGVMEAMLQLALSIKSGNPLNPVDSVELAENKSPSATETESSPATALKAFLTKYQLDPIDIDTAIFEQNRTTDTDRDIEL